MLSFGFFFEEKEKNRTNLKRFESMIFGGFSWKSMENSLWQNWWEKNLFLSRNDSREQSQQKKSLKWIKIYFYRYIWIRYNCFIITWFTIKSILILLSYLCQYCDKNFSQIVSESELYISQAKFHLTELLLRDASSALVALNLLII